MTINVAYQPAQPFTPHRLVSQPHVQTLLARYRPAGLTVEQREQPVLLDAGADITGWDRTRPVRLLGYYTPSLTHFGSRGLVLVLHGWEGCSHSVYNLLAADTLNRAGYDVFRLNARDHGPGLHVDPYALNRGFFLGTLIDEIAVATQRIATMAGDRPFYITGASMGGNLALRLALRHRQQPFPNLAQVIAFNPAINPLRCVRALDAQRPYLRYFRSRWFASLRAKQRLFPELFNFDELATIPQIHAMTEWLVARYGQHFGNLRNADDYYSRYSVIGDAFHDLSVPTTIITAANDRVVPVEDFYELTPHPLLKLQVHPNGGHVGYVDLFPLEHKLPRLLLHVLQQTQLS
jgi:uncharacterized protein